MKVFIIPITGILLLTASSFIIKEKSREMLYHTLNSYLQNVEKDFNKIPEDRKIELKKIASFVSTHLGSEKKANLIFICTHNSRRSHMAQLFAYAAAAYYGIEGVNNYSGGLEVTAFNPRAVAALTKAGFLITKKTEDTNPVYETKFGDNLPAITSFSKKYKDPPNPTSNFAAIMTCSHADKDCPIVFGASLKIATPYEYPKDADGARNETEVYNERCKQIATEVLYIFSLVKAYK